MITETYYKVLRHWEDNVVASINGNRDDFNDSCHNCAFCKDAGYKFLNPPDCRLCPIYDDTKGFQCDGTPWEYVNPIDPETVWMEFVYLLNLAYCNGKESLYIKEI